MILHLKAALLSVTLGLLIGGIWETIGATFLWTLADPKPLLFAAAMIAWPIIGLVMATVLRVTEIIAPHYKNFVKVLTMPVAFITAVVTNATGLLTFRVLEPSLLGVPLYMVIGMTALIFTLDHFGIQGKK